MTTPAGSAANAAGWAPSGMLRLAGEEGACSAHGSAPLSRPSPSSTSVSKLASVVESARCWWTWSFSVGSRREPFPPDPLLRSERRLAGRHEVVADVEPCPACGRCPDLANPDTRRRPADRPLTRWKSARDTAEPARTRRQITRDKESVATSRGWRYLVGTLLVGITLGLVGGLLGASLFLPRAPGPAPSVQSYLDGYAHADGHRIWASYSRAARERLVARGQTEEATVAFYDWLRTRPGKVERVAYLGGYRTPDHGAYLYLVAGHKDDGSAIADTWYFTTDEDGLIDAIL